MYLCVCVALVVLLFFGFSFYNTAPCESLRTIEDSITKYHPAAHHPVVVDGPLPGIADIPIEVVNEHLFSNTT
eukprot:m.136241 g.136241  ORF g.136241 m.136241 type:complete len:73 (+) comp23945_c0_seq1:232-450(+)